VPQIVSKIKMTDTIMNEKFENLKVLTCSFNFALFTKLISSFSRIKSARPNPSTFLKAYLSS